MPETEIVLTAENLLDLPVDEIDKQILEQMIDSLSHHAPPSEISIERIRELRTAAIRFAALIVMTQKNSRNRSLALTNLEQCVMWAVKGVVLEDKSAKIDTTETK